MMKTTSEVLSVRDIPPYQKINGFQKRWTDGPLKGKFNGEWVTPEIEYLADNVWWATEKVDGTNIRIGFSMFDSHGEDAPGLHYVIGGRTDNAQIPSALLQVLTETVTSIEEEILTTFESSITTTYVTIFGEGYGAGIQSGGNYSRRPAFVVFDILVGYHWLRREDVVGICKSLNLEVVPEIFMGMSLNEMIGEVAGGILSDWGDFPAEGVVAQPLVPMFDRRGHRVITKVKTKDLR